MSTLLTRKIIESQRLQTILDETTNKLMFLESIIPDALQHREELSKFVGDEISQIIAEQRCLEQRYETLILHRAMLKGYVNKHKFKDVQDEIREISQALRDSTKHLCRNLQDNPNIAGNLFKIQRERQAIVDLLRQTSVELSVDGSMAEIQKTVRWDKAEQDNLNSVIQHEIEMSETVKQLDNDLVEEKVSHRQQIVSLSTDSFEAKQLLLAVKSQTSSDSMLCQREAHAEACSRIRIQSQSWLSKQSISYGLQARQEFERIVHESTVLVIRWRLSSLLKGLEEWKQRYATDLEILESDFHSLTEDRLSKLKRLQHLRERREDEVHAERCSRERSEMQHKIEVCRSVKNKKKNSAARFIQRTVRTFLHWKAGSVLHVSEPKSTKSSKK